MLATVNSLSLARDQEIEIREFQIKSFAEIEICQCSFKEINAGAEMYFMPDKVFKTTFLTGFK